MDDESKQLLREIRDLMAASQGRYDQALAENKRQYQEHLARMQRSLAIIGGIIGAGVAAIILLSK